MDNGTYEYIPQFVAYGNGKYVALGEVGKLTNKFDPEKDYTSFQVIPLGIHYR